MILKIGFNLLKIGATKKSNGLARARTNTSLVKREELVFFLLLSVTLSTSKCLLKPILSSYNLNNI